MAKRKADPTPDELKRREYQREWSRKNREKRNAASLRHYHRNKDYYADWHLKNKYGVSLEEKRAMYAAQGGVCLVCKESEATELDHCHASGAVRGLLCEPCNLTLGLVKDRTDVLQNAITYLNDRTNREPAVCPQAPI